MAVSYAEAGIGEEYQTLADYQKATGLERGSRQQETDMGEYGLKLFTIRLPHSRAPHKPVPIVGNPVRYAVHHDPLRGGPDPYFWKATRSAGIRLDTSRRPFLEGKGPRVALDAPAVVWLTATGMNPEEAKEEAGGWWSPNLPTVPGARIQFSFLVDGQDLVAATEDAVVSWVRFSSLTGQHV